MFDTTNYADKIPPAVLVGLINWGKKERPVSGNQLLESNNGERSLIKKHLAAVEV